MRTKLVGLLRPLDAFAVENGGCHPGTPDINHRDGWIECKATNRWPARPDTPVALDHPLTQGQRIWLWKRARVNGACHVMLTVAGEWLLFDGKTAADHLGRATRAKLYELALCVWTRTPTTKELLQWLKSSATPT